MKRWIFFLALCLGTLAGHAATETESDSLQRLVRTLPHDSIRLAVFSSIAKIEQNNSECITFSDSLLKEALYQKNHKYATLAAYYRLVYYYNRTERDSVAKWIPILETYVQKSGMWDYYFDAKRFQIDLYTYDEEYERAIDEALKMKRTATERKSSRGLVGAYQCLSNAYIGSQRWNEGVEALEEAHRLLTSKDSPVVRISVLTQLVSLMKESGENKKLLRYLQELEEILTAYIAAHPSLEKGFYDVFLFIDLFYAHYYLHTQQPQQAWQHLTKCGNYLNENSYFMYRVLYFDTYAKYHEYIGEYQRASAFIDTTLQMLRQDFPSDYAEQLLKKARLATAAGKSENAFPLYRQALQIKDSAATDITNIQLEQIKSKYDLKKLQLERTKLDNEWRMIGLSVIILILIASTLFMLRVFHIRKQLKHSENEIRQVMLKVKKANEIKNSFLSNMSYNIRTPLNNVVGFSQFIASEPDMPEEQRKEYAQIIQKSAETLLNLVNCVLDLSRLEAGRMKFQIQEYDVVAFCNDVVYMARMRNENTGIRISFHTDIEMQNITTDTTRLGEALLSGLTCPGECTDEREIEFTLAYADEDHREVCFRIVNSPLADPAFVSQDTLIRHDINRLLLKHFGGSYQVEETTSQGPTLVFIYPVDSKFE